jgi:hypothetical protein
MLAPAHAGFALHHINHAFEMTMMMSAGLGVRLNRDGSGPQFLRANAGEVDRRRTIHPLGRGNIGVEIVRGNDTDTVMFPAVRIMAVIVGMIVRMGVIVTVAGHGSAFSMT